MLRHTLQFYKFERSKAPWAGDDGIALIPARSGAPPPRRVAARPGGAAVRTGLAAGAVLPAGHRRLRLRRRAEEARGPTAPGGPPDRRPAPPHRAADLWRVSGCCYNRELPGWVARNPKTSRSMENIRDSVGMGLRKGFTPMLSALHKLGVTPNQVTIAGTVLNAGAAVLVVSDHLIWAGILVLVAGLLRHARRLSRPPGQEGHALRRLPRFHARPGLGGGRAGGHRLLPGQPGRAPSTRPSWCSPFLAASW